MRPLDDKYTIERIEKKLKEVVQKTAHSYACSPEFKEKLRQNIHEELLAIKRNSSIVLSMSMHTIYDIKNIDITTDAGNEEVIASLSFQYEEKQNFSKYGGPGYEGLHEGQICEYPPYHGIFYRWNTCICRWETTCSPEETVSSGPNTQREQSFSDKLFGNAAFEAPWGNGGMSGEIFDSGRGANGEKVWGTVPIGSPMPTWNKMDFSKIFEAIYKLSLNIKEIIGFGEKVNDLIAKNKDNPKDQTEIDKILQDTIAVPKIPVKIERLNHYSYFMNNGFVNESGNYTVKDSLVHTISDKENFLKELNSLNQEKMDKALYKFKNR